MALRCMADGGDGVLDCFGFGPDQLFRKFSGAKRAILARHPVDQTDQCCAQDPVARCGRMHGHIRQLDRPGTFKLMDEIRAFIRPKPSPGKDDNRAGPKLRRGRETFRRCDQFLDRLPAGNGTVVLHLGARRHFGLP